MIETLTPYRPGLTAIAAVLALSSTAAVAQVALPDASPPPADVGAAPTTAPAAPAQTVQSVPTAPTLPDIAVAETPVEAAPVAQAAPRQWAQAVTRTAERAAPVARAAAPVQEPVRAEPATRTVTPVADNAGSAPPAASSVTAEEAAPVQSARTEAAASDDMGTASWVLLGGGLLIVAGGAAFALGRRPKRREDVQDAELAYATTVTPTVAPMAPAAAFAATPVIADAPRRVQPAIRTSRVNVEDSSDRHATLEAMVAEAPSVANPFHSRRNRLRRADFLLRTGQVQPLQQDAAITSAAASQRSAPDRWSEMRLAGVQKPRVLWKPVKAR